MGSYARHARLLGEWDDSIGVFTSEVTALFSLMKEFENGSYMY